MNLTLFFVAVLIAVVVGWSLGMISNWLILARTLPWLDVKMLPRPAARPMSKPDLIPLDSALNGTMQQTLSVTGVDLNTER